MFCSGSSWAISKPQTSSASADHQTMWPLNRTVTPILRSSLPFMTRVRFSEFTRTAVDFPSHQSIPEKLRCDLPPLARRMLDDGVLQSVDHNIATKGYSPILANYLAECSTPEERHEAVVSLTFLLKVRRLSETACENCLYRKKRCVCSVVEQVKPKHNLWVFQHHREFGRSNNTGGLLCLVTGAKRTIRGLREQQDEMLGHATENSHSTAILFPTAESTTLGQYMEARSAAQGKEIEADPLTLILLDGTSRQARNLDRFMPHIIPRIRIGLPRVMSWLDPIRRQSEQHRVCTAQAAAMILRELKDDHTSDAIENAVRNVVRLASKERSLLLQRESKFFEAPLSAS